MYLHSKNEHHSLLSFLEKCTCKPHLLHIHTNENTTHIYSTCTCMFWQKVWPILFSIPKSHFLIKHQGYSSRFRQKMEFGVGNGIEPISVSTCTSSVCSILYIYKFIQYLCTCIHAYTLNCNTPHHAPSFANRGDTSKNAVLQYVSSMSDDSMHSSQDPDLSPRDRDMAIDDTLLWRFLFLLCQQNGVLVPSDISELLTRGLDTPISPSRGVGVGGVKETERDDDALQEFRLCLLSGRKKVG